jgi:hypothetical protein
VTVTEPALAPSTTWEPVPALAEPRQDLAVTATPPQPALPVSAANPLGVPAVPAELYAIGGTDNSFETFENNPTGTVQIYNPNTQAWSPGPSLNTARFDLGAATGGNGTIFAIGGTEFGSSVSGSDFASNVVEYLSPDAPQWLSGPNLPTGRTELAVVAGPDGRIYAIGGENASGTVVGTAEALTFDSAPFTAASTTLVVTPPQTTLTAAIDSNQTTITVASTLNFPAAPFLVRIDSEELDVTAVNGTTWTVTRGFPSGTTGATPLSGSLVTLAKVSLIGSTETVIDVASDAGFPTTSLPFVVTIDNEQLDVTAVNGTAWTVTRGFNNTTPATHLNGATISFSNWSWQGLPAMPTPVASPAVVSFEGQIFVIGGTTAGDQFSDLLQTFNPSSLAWTQQQLPFAVAGPVQAAIGSDGNIYAIQNLGSGKTSVEEFEPLGDTGIRIWENLPNQSLPASVGNFVLTSGADGRIYAITESPPPLFTLNGATPVSPSFAFRPEPVFQAPEGISSTGVAGAFFDPNLADTATTFNSGLVTLSAGITRTATSITVSSVGAFVAFPTTSTGAPATPFIAEIFNELVDVTAVHVGANDSSTWTVTRGFDGTQAASQVAGTEVFTSPLINWGDNTPPTLGTVVEESPGDFVIEGTHTYNPPNPSPANAGFTANVQLVADDGRTLAGAVTANATVIPATLTLFNATTTLVTGLIASATATTLTVTSSGGFPAAPFAVIIDHEELEVTDVNGTTWTVTRGINGTTIASHLGTITIPPLLGRPGITIPGATVSILETLPGTVGNPVGNPVPFAIFDSNPLATPSDFDLFEAFYTIPSLSPTLQPEPGTPDNEALGIGFKFRVVPLTPPPLLPGQTAQAGSYFEIVPQLTQSNTYPIPGTYTIGFGLTDDLDQQFLNFNEVVNIADPPVTFLTSTNTVTRTVPGLAVLGNLEAQQGSNGIVQGTALTDVFLPGASAAQLATFTSTNPALDSTAFIQSVVVNWGDGSSDNFFPNDPSAPNNSTNVGIAVFNHIGAGPPQFDVTGQHKYGNGGTFTVTLTLTDIFGGISQIQQTVTVNVASIEFIPGTGNVDVAQGVFLNAVAGSTSTLPLGFVFTDAPEPTAGFQISINWGDNTSSSSGTAKLVGGNGVNSFEYELSGTHTYQPQLVTGVAAKPVFPTITLTVPGPSTPADPTGNTSFTVGGPPGPNNSGPITVSVANPQFFGPTLVSYLDNTQGTLNNNPSFTSNIPILGNILNKLTDGSSSIQFMSQLGALLAAQLQPNVGFFQANLVNATLPSSLAFDFNGTPVTVSENGNETSISAADVQTAIDTQGNLESTTVEVNGQDVVEPNTVTVTQIGNFFVVALSTDNPVTIVNAANDTGITPQTPLPSQAGGGILDAQVLTAALQEMASGLNAINPGLPSLAGTISPQNSAVITGLSNTSQLSLGMPVSGSGIPAGTTIAAILSGTSIQLSNPATGSDSVSLTFPTFIFNAAAISGSTTTGNYSLNFQENLNTSPSFQFAVGLGLPLSVVSVQGNLGVNLNFSVNWNLSFTIAATGTTLGMTHVSSNLQVSGKATLPQDFGVQATLGPLSVEIRDGSRDPLNPNPADPTVVPGSDLNFGLTVGLSDTGGVISFTAVPTFNFVLSLFIDASIEGSNAFPSMLADLKVTLSPSFDVQFDNVRLDLGSFISQFAQPLINALQGITEPLEPIAQFLLEPVPGISQLNNLVGHPLGNQTITFGYVLGVLGGLTGDQISDLLTFAQAVNTINNIHFNFTGGDVFVPLGSIDLGNLNSSGNVQPPTPATPILPSIDPATGLPTGIPNPLAYANNLLGQNFFAAPDDPGASCDFGTSSQGSSTLDFPILDSPTLFVNLLLGQPVQLVKFSLSANVGLNLNVIIPFDEFAIPLNAIITMGVDLKVGATFILTSQALTASNPLSGLLVQNAFATFTFSVGAGGGVDVGIGSLDLVLSLSVSFTITLTDNDLSSQYDNTTTIPFTDLFDVTAFDNGGNPFDHVGVDVSNPTGTLTLSINAYDPLGDQVGQLTLGSVAFTL